MLEYEQFIGMVRTSGSSTTLEISIPYKTAQFMGLKAGDDVKVMIQKVRDNEEK